MKRTLCSSIVMAALACAALMATPAVAAASKHKSLFVETKPSATPVDPETLRCGSLSKGVSEHIENIKAFNAQIQKEHRRPSDVEGMVEEWGGYRRAELTEVSDKVAKERRTAEEIAALLPAYKCPPIDIDAELQKPPVRKPPPETASKKHKSKVF